MARSKTKSVDSTTTAEAGAGATADAMMAGPEPSAVLESAEMELGGIIAAAVKSAVDSMKDRLEKAGISGDEMAALTEQAVARAVDSAASASGGVESAPDVSATVDPTSAEHLHLFAAEVADRMSANLLASETPPTNLLASEAPPTVVAAEDPWPVAGSAAFAAELSDRVLASVAPEFSPGPVAAESMPLGDVLTRLRSQRDALSVVIDSL